MSFLQLLVQIRADLRRPLLQEVLRVARGDAREGLVERGARVQVLSGPERLVGGLEGVVGLVFARVVAEERGNERRRVQDLAGQDERLRRRVCEASELEEGRVESVLKLFLSLSRHRPRLQLRVQPVHLAEDEGDEVRAVQARAVLRLLFQVLERQVAPRER